MKSLKTVEREEELVLSMISKLLENDNDNDNDVDDDPEVCSMSKVLNNLQQPFLQVEIKLGDEAAQQHI